MTLRRRGSGSAEKRSERMRIYGEAGVLAVAMICCIALGGASRAGFIANAVVQIVSLGLIGWSIVQLGGRRLAADERYLWGLGIAFVGLFVVQLLPLPYAAWSALPGRAPIAQGLARAGLADPWLPLSLTWEYTLRALLGVLPALAFMLILPRTRRPVADLVVGTVLVMAIVSALLGLLQVGSGAAATTYLYTITNRGSAVGFFANANHLATLMVISVPLAAGLFTALVARRTAARRGILTLMSLAPVVAVVSVALVLTDSTAGIGLLGLALAGSVPIVFADYFRERRWLIVCGAALAMMLVIAVIGSMVLLDHGTVDGMARPYMWRTTLVAINDFFGAGSGFGTFERIFHLVEDRAAITVLYANHAHNDLLELTLEAGLPGLILLALFLWWFARASWAIWTDPARRDPLAQGASLAILLILLHSLVDYPLRSAAMAAVFGLCCALVARPPRTAVQPIAKPEALPTARHLSA